MDNAEISLLLASPAIPLIAPQSRSLVSLQYDLCCYKGFKVEKVTGHMVAMGDY